MEILTLHTHLGLNDLYPKSCAYGKTFTGRQMLQIACQMHNILFNENILLKLFTDNNEVLLTLDDTLEMQGIQDQDHIFIIEPISDDVLQSIPILPNGLDLPPLDNSNFGLPFLVPPSIADYSFGSLPAPPFQLPPPPGALQMQMNIGTAPAFMTPPLEISQFNSFFGSENLLPFNSDMPIQMEPYDSFFATEVNSDNERGRTYSELEIQIKNFSVDFEDTSTDLYSLAQIENANFITLLTKNPQSNSSHSLNITYKYDFTFGQVVQSAKENLGMRTDTYEILIGYSENFKEWFSHDKILEDYNIFANTTLYILKAKQAINIKGPDDKSIKLIIDVTDEVSKIIQTYAHKVGIEDVEGYSLFIRTKINDKRTLIPLRSDIDIPSQSFDFSHLIFKRRFFMITGELVSTEYKLARTYREIVDELSSNKDIYMTREEAIALTTYRAIVEGEGSEITTETEVHNLVPKRFKHQKIRTNHCISFLGERKISDTEAMFEYIKIARLFPGLGAFVFEVEANDRRAQLIVTPFEVILNGMNGEETIISFKQIVKVDRYGNSAVISYSKNHKLLNFSVVSSQMSDIEYCINTYNQLIRSTILKRAGSNASLISLNTMMMFDKKSASSFDYDINSTGRMVLEKAINNLGIRGELNDFALLAESESEKRWIKLDDPVLLQEIYDGCSLHVMPCNHIVVINLPDQSVQTITIELTLTCDQIIELVFQAIGQEFTYGFSLYNKGVPMSGDLSLPEQTEEIGELSFQRRFYVISRDDIRTPMLQNFAFADCRRYLLTEELEMTDSVAASCSAFMLLISGISISDYNNMKDNYLKENYVPKLIDVSSSLRQEILSKMKEYAKKDRRHMINAFIRLAREIDCFGTESYSVEFRDITRQIQLSAKKYILGVARIGPTNVTVIVSNTKKSIKIPYKDIVKLSKRCGDLILEFTSRNCLKLIDIRCDKVGQLYDVIIKSIRIFKNIIKDRRKKDEENALEEKLRLDGNFIDGDGQHSPQIDVYIYKELSNRDHSTMMWLDIDYTQEQIMKRVMERLNIQPKNTERLGVMMRRQDGYTSWLRPGMIFSDIKPQRKSSIYIIPQFKTIQIDSLLGLKKKMEIDLSMKIKILIPLITQEFGINVPYGYSLWSDGRALDLRKTIPEQTHNFSVFALRRRFFPIYREKNMSIGEIMQSYAEMNKLVKKGFLEFSIQDAIKLAYYELAVTHGEKLIKNLIPADLTVYLPPNVQSTRSIQKEVVNLTNTQKITEQEARKEYAEIVRSHPKFAHEEYQISNNVNDMLLTVTPEWIQIMNLSSMKEIATISYEYLLDITGVDNRIMIVYSERGLLHRSIFFKSNEVDQIIYAVKSYVQINKEIILDAAQNTVFNNINVIGSDYQAFSEVSYWLYSAPQRLTYDLRMSSEMVTDKAVRFLKLDRSKKYSILMRYSNHDSKWLVKQKPVGVLHPFIGIRMILFDKNAKITVEFNGIKYIVRIKVSSTIGSLVETLGFRFGLWSDIGYTLFIKENDEMVPLTLNKSIPEQTTLNKIFYFDRQYYIVTQYDLSTPFVLMPQMEDFKKFIMSGKVSMSNRDLIELIACDLYAHAKSPMDVKNNPIDDISSYIPMGYKTSKDLVSMLNRLIQSSPAMNNVNAAQQYILTARDLEGFSSRMFKVQMLSETTNGGSEYIDVKMYINTVSVKFKDMKETCLIKVSLKKIVSIVEAKVVMQMRVQRHDGSLVVIQIQSSDCSVISNYLSIICDNIIPNIIEREELQKNRIAAETRNEEDLPISVITKPTADPVPIYIPMDLYGQEIINFLGKVFFIKEYQNYQVFALQNSTKTVLQDDMSILSLNINPGDAIYFISPIVNVVITFLDDDYNLDVNITNTVSEICIDISKQLNLGNPEGFTLYANDGKAIVPLNTEDFLLNQTKSIWNLEIRRRFYNFTLSFFEDPLSLRILYQDVKRSFLRGNIHPNKDVTIHLAVLLIFADLRDPWLYENNIKKVKALFPAKYKFDENTYQQFVMAMKNYKQTSDMVSIMEFLAECVVLNGYGCEEYSVKFTNEDISKAKEATIIFSPFSIRIVSQKNDKVYLTISYKNIIQFMTIDDITFMIKYYDSDIMVESIKIIGDIYTPEIINTYITGILNIKESMHFLYTAEEYHEGILRSFPEHIESRDNIIQSSGGSNPLAFNVSGILNFNDLNDIYLQQLESTIPETDFFLNITNNGALNLNFEPPPINNSFLGETPTDAISSSVALKSLSAIKRYLDQIRENISVMEPFEFDMNSNQISDIFNSINFGDGNPTLIEITERIRDRIQDMKITSNDLFSDDYKTIEVFGDRINEVLDNFNKDLEDASSFVSSSIYPPFSLVPVASAMISVADCEMDLAVALVGCKRLVSKIVSNIDSIYSNIYNSALSFTNIASNVTSDSNIENIDQMILPYIVGLSQIIHQITDICESSEAISANVSSLKAALEATSNAYNNLTAITSPKNEQTDGNELPIQKTTTSIKEAIRVLRELASRLPTNVASELMSSQYYLSQSVQALRSLSSKTEFSQYVAQKAMLVLRDQIKQLKAHNIAYINLNELTQIQQEIESSVYSISQVNITIANVSTIQQDVQSMIEIIDQCEEIESAIPDLHQILKDIEAAKNNLISNCVSAEYIQQNQKVLLKLKSLLDDFIKKAPNVRDDSRLFLVIEKLETDLDSALCEPVPTEDLNQCAHISQYHEAQASVSSLINLIQSIIKEPLRAHDSIAQIDELLQDAYNKIATQRAKLHEQPLSQVVIEKSKTVLSDALAVTTASRTVAIDLFKETGNCDLETASKETYKSLQDCIKELGKVKAKKYYKPPTEEQIDNIRMATVNVIMKIEEEKMNSENDIKRFKALDKESQYLKKKIETIDSMKRVDDMSFYIYAEKIRDRIQTISNRVSETRRISQSAMPTFRLYLKEFRPTTETVKSDIAKVIPDIEEMLKFLNTLHENIPESDEEAESALTNWIKSINDGISILKARMTEDYKQGYVLRDKAAMSILEDQLSNVPMIIRRSLSSEQSQTLSMLMSKAIESQSNLINCMRNLPMSGSININIQDFQLIEEESDVVQSINELNHQMEELKNVYHKVISLPQIANRPHTERISKSIASLVTQISNDIQTLLNDEKGLKLILINAETEMKKIAKDSELVQSILSIPSLNQATENVTKNISTAMKLLQVPHMGSNEMTSFKAKVKPKLAFLISSIKGMKDNVKSEHMEEFYSLLEAVNKQIDTANSKEIVEVCDNLYDCLTQLQRKVFDKVDLNQLTNMVLDTLTIASTYTAKPPPDIRYTIDLIPNAASLIEPSVFEMINQSIRSNHQLKITTKTIIREAVADIKNNPMKYPLYMHEMKYLSQLAETSHHSVLVRLASILALFNPDFDRRKKLLESICVSSYIRFTSEVKSLAMHLSEQRYNGERVLKFLESVADCDESIIGNTQTLAAISLMFTQLHVIKSNLVEMKNCADREIKLKCYNCERWIYESDLALMNLLYGEIDCLCVKLEEEKPECTTSFIRPAVLYLKGRERECCLSFKDASNLYILFTEFCNSDLGGIDSVEIQEMAKKIKMNSPFMNYAKMRNSILNRMTKKSIADSAFTHFKADIEILSSIQDTSPAEISIEFKRLKSYVDEGISACKEIGVGMKDIILEIRQIQSMIETIDTTVSTNTEMVSGILPILIPHLDAAIGSVQSHGLQLSQEEGLKLDRNVSMDMIPPSEAPIITHSDISPLAPSKSEKMRKEMEAVKEAVAVIPKEECIDILNKESASLIPFLFRDNKDKEKINDVFSKRIPQIAAAADIVIGGLPEKARHIINTDSKKLIDLASQIGDSESDEDQKKAAMFALESALVCIRAATSRSIDVDVKDLVISLYQSVSSNNFEKASKDLWNINGVRAYNAVNGITDIELELLIKPISEISSYVHSQLINPRKEIERPNPNDIIDVLVKSRKSPLDLIYSSDTQEDLNQLIQNTMKSFYKEVKYIIANESNHNNEALKRHMSYISSFAYFLFATVLHNITMHNINDLELYQDLSSRIIQIVINIQDINNEERTLKRRLRSITRMAESSALFLDIEVIKTEQKKDIEKASINISKSIDNVVIMALGIKSTFDSIIIEEVSVEKLKPFMRQIDYLKSNVKDCLNDILEINTDEGSGEVFSRSIDYFIQSFDCFIASKSNDDLLKVAESANHCIESVERLSDAPLFKPDVERADMIPREFTMPPSVMTDIHIAAAHVESAVMESVVCIEEMRTTDFMLIFPKFIPAVSEAIQYCISASHEVTSLKMQSRLTNKAASIVSDMSQLFSVLRYHYLTNSQEDPFPLLESIAVALGEIVVSTREASEIARNEEKEHSEVVVKFTKILKHLQSALKTVELSVTLIDESRERDWIHSLFKVCSLLINSTVHAVLKAKEDPQSEQTDNVLKFANEISGKVMEVCADTHTEKDMRQVVINAMEEIKRVIDKYEGIEGIEQAVSETESLLKFASTSLSGSNRRIRKKQLTTNANAHLLERLHYESRVIKARMELEKSECLIRSLE